MEAGYYTPLQLIPVPSSQTQNKNPKPSPQSTSPVHVMGISYKFKTISFSAATNQVPATWTSLSPLSGDTLLPETHMGIPSLLLGRYFHVMSSESPSLIPLSKLESFVTLLLYFLDNTYCYSTFLTCLSVPLADKLYERGHFSVSPSLEIVTEIW